jgi:hypothetical protein
MKEQVPAWLGITCVVLMFGLAVFVVFAFRQGSKVRRPAEGVPPEQIPPV